MKINIDRSVLLGTVMILVAVFGAACLSEHFPEMTTDEFMSALAENNRSNLMRLTTSSAKPQVEVWLSSNPHFKCRVALWDFEGERVEIYPADSTIQNSNAVDGGTVTHDAMYFCRTQDSVFILTVKDIVLTPIQEGSHQTWLVESWGETCVAHDYSTCFDEP
jgi:hypothetical protein